MNSRSIYAILLSIISLLYFSFIFSSSGTELTSQIGSGWIGTLINYLILLIITIFNFIFFLRKISISLYQAVAIFFLITSAFSLISSLLPFLRPEYFPETLILPVCNTIYLFIVWLLHRILIDQKTKL